LSVELVTRLKTDLKAAMRTKDTVTSTVLRGILSDITYAQKSTQPPKHYFGLVQSALKQRQESIRQFQQAQRLDLVEKEAKEATILENYLPKQMTDSKVQVKLLQLCQELGIQSKRDLGKLMAQVNQIPELSLVSKELIVKQVDGFIASKTSS
jgi:uncharacterized protein YqeY